MLISFHKHLYYIFNIPNLKIKSQTDFSVSICTTCYLVVYSTFLIDTYYLCNLT